MSQHILRQRHGLCKAVVRTVRAIPPGIVRGDDIGQLVAAARIIVQIQRLYKALVKAARVHGADKLRPQLPPQQAESRIGHTVLPHGAVFGMMIERAVPNVEYQPCKALRHCKATLYGNVGVAYLQKRRAEHIVGVKFSAVGKCGIGYLQNIVSFKVP